MKSCPICKKAVKVARFYLYYFGRCVNGHFLTRPSCQKKWNISSIKKIKMLLPENEELSIWKEFGIAYLVDVK